MKFNRSVGTGRKLRASVRACVLLLAVAAVACDIPTESPNFGFTPTVRAPLILASDFVFLGPDSAGTNAFIDTTSARFDSLFTIGPDDNVVYLVEKLDNLNIGALDQPIDPVTMSSVPVAFDVGTFSRQQFDIDHSESVSPLQSAAFSAPPVAPTVNGSDVQYPGGPSQLLPLPSGGLIDLSGSQLTSYTFSQDQNPFNVLTFQLTNGLAERLTDGSFAPGTTPDVVVRSASGAELRRQSFDISPATNETAVVAIDMAGVALPSNAGFFLDVGTANGMGPIATDPGALQTRVSSTTLRYSAVTVDRLAPQSSLNAGTSGVGVSGTVNFSGVIARSGSITLSITNSLPVDVQVTDLSITNDIAVGSHPVGSTVAQTSGVQIVARGTTTVVLPLASTPIAAVISVSVAGTSPGNTTTTSIRASDGLTIDANIDMELAELIYRPAGEQFVFRDTVGFDIDELDFAGPGDFIELEAGFLDVESLVNELDVTVDRTEISFPGILTAPYNAGDSLVLRINQRLVRSGGTVPDRTIDLAGMRVIPTGNVIDYTVRAYSETAPASRTLRQNDRIRGVVQARGLTVREISAVFVPFSVELSRDANQDGMLDALDNSEAEITNLDLLSDLDDFNLRGLQTRGARLALEVNTDVAANFEIYGAIVGINAAGEQVYLAGTGAQRVAALDTMAAAFRAGAAPIDANDLIKLTIQGSPSVGKTVSRSIVLDAGNSTVDAFISSLPEQVRFVGKAVVQPDGGPGHLRLPAVLDASLSVVVPLSVAGNLTAETTMDADLSAFDGLDDPDRTVNVNEAALLLEYDNGFPLGVTTRIDILDALGEVVMSLPEPQDPVMTVAAADADEDGLSLNSRSGVIRIPLDEARVRDLARGRRATLLLELQTGGNSLSTVRASDRIAVSLQGVLDLEITVD